MGPCHIGNGGCSPMAVCVATTGMVQCFCRPGYEGMAVGPMGCAPRTGGGGGGGPIVPGAGGGGIVLSPCASGPCLNGATCYPLATSFHCTCASGFTGAACEATVNFCDSGPCLNGGTCVGGFDSYRCACDANYEGTNCQDEAQGCGGDFTGVGGVIDFPHGEGTTYGHDLR